jgi:uncharacterized NAD-dependent epimerase/dehydratase family protein
MHVLPPYHRILLLTEGQLGPFTSKTAASLLRYRPADVIGILDSHAAGQDVRAVIPWSPPLPIVPDIAAARSLAPDALFVGIAPPGGALPSTMHRQIADALAAGIDIVSGLHQFLADNAELATLAATCGTRIFDLRRPPFERVIAAARACSTRCRRVLTVGTDGNVGKMLAALELTAAARRRGLNAEFLATGQTGAMIAGRGVAIDAVVADFAPGAVEELVLSAAGADICFIEGQGSIAHPGFSAVTLALLHGACPDAMILVHHAGRTHYSAAPHLKIPPLAELRAAYESAASLLHPARIVGIALNPLGCNPAAARAEARLLAQELRLPICDPMADGCEPLMDAVVDHIGAMRS